MVQKDVGLVFSNGPMEVSIERAFRGLTPVLHITNVHSRTKRRQSGITKGVCLGPEYVEVRLACNAERNRKQERSPSPPSWSFAVPVVILPEDLVRVAWLCGPVS